MQVRAETLLSYLRWKKTLRPLQAQIAVQAFYYQDLEADAAYRRSGTPRHPSEDDLQLEALESLEREIIVARRRGNIASAGDVMNAGIGSLAEANPASPDFGELCQSVLRVPLEIVRRMKEREEGNWGGVPSDPILLANLAHPAVVGPLPVVAACPQIQAPWVPATPAKADVTTEPSMEDLIEKFFLEKRKASSRGESAAFGKYEREFRASLEWFRQFCDGFKTPGAYTKRDFVRYKDALLEVPKNFRKFYPGRSIKEAIIENKAIGRPTLDANTIKNKRLGDLRTFFRWLHNNHYIGNNPVDGVSVVRNKNADRRQKRYPFTIDDLKKIFCSDEFRELQVHRGVNPSDDRLEAHKYWLPLLALYSGCRMAELAQLLCTDVGTENGRLFLRITEEVKAATQDFEQAKSVKNSGSERVVPVHPDLIKLGFDKFVAAAKASPNDRLFSGCWRSCADGSFTPYSKFFARFLKKAGVKKDQMLAFHSFRHNFEDAMLEAGLYQHVRYRFAGRVDNHSSAGYGNGHRPARLFEEISKIQYPGLDLSHLGSPGMNPLAS